MLRVPVKLPNDALLCNSGVDVMVFCHCCFDFVSNEPSNLRHRNNWGPFMPPWHQFPQSNKHKMKYVKTGGDVCLFEIGRNSGSTILRYNLTESQNLISMTTFSVVISEKPQEPGQ